MHKEPHQPDTLGQRISRVLMTLLVIATLLFLFLLFTGAFTTYPRY